MLTTMSENKKRTSLSGTVTIIVFANSDNGWCVLRVRDDEGHEHAVVGEVAGVFLGEYLKMEGQWVTDQRYGRQFQVARVKADLPISPESTKKFLAEAIHGIGPQMSTRIVEAFGDNTYTVLDESPDRLKEVPGIGATLLHRIKNGWSEHRAFREVLGFLLEHGVGAANAWRIYDKYGERAVRAMQANPWRPARDIKGIGFLTADKLARSLGAPFNCPERIQAGLIHVLRSQAEENGHLYLLRADLVDEALTLVGEESSETTAEAIDLEVCSLHDQGLVVIEKSADGELVYLAHLHEAESSVAEWFRERMSTPLPSNQVDVDAELAAFQEEMNLPLAKEQDDAVRLAFTSRFVVLTGPPGTGKSTILAAVVRLFKKAKKNVQLASPTGRAASRMEEVTGAKASTIHQMLGYNGRTYVYNEERPLRLDVLVLDEVSMLDMALTWRMLRALPHHAQVIFVGDIDQLPSVGPGAVLAQLLASPSIPSVRLTKIFRQGRGSQIAMAAQAINQGKMPKFYDNSDPKGDCYFVEAEDPEEATETLVNLVSNLIPRHFKIDPIVDIQTMAPMKKGSFGTENLNRSLQRQLNGYKVSVQVGDVTFREGDRVMQTRNDYDRGVYNGDVGFIRRIHEEKKLVIIDYGKAKDVIMPFPMMKNVVLAYCSTIHRCQGAEFPIVLVALHTQHYKLLQRNLLYTAITRAKKLAIIIGTRKALGITLGTNPAVNRNTRLATLIG